MFLFDRSKPQTTAPYATEGRITPVYIHFVILGDLYPKAFPMAALALNSCLRHLLVMLSTCLFQFSLSSNVIPRCLTVSLNSMLYFYFSGFVPFPLFCPKGSSLDSTNSIAMLSRDFDSFFVLEASGKCIIGTLTFF